MQCRKRDGEDLTELDDVQPAIVPKQIDKRQPGYPTERQQSRQSRGESQRYRAVGLMTHGAGIVATTRRTARRLGNYHPRSGDGIDNPVDWPYAPRRAKERFLRRRGFTLIELLVVIA